jgi:hypothetical protein
VKKYDFLVLFSEIGANIRAESGERTGALRISYGTDLRGNNWVPGVLGSLQWCPLAVKSGNAPLAFGKLRQSCVKLHQS